MSIQAVGWALGVRAPSIGAKFVLTIIADTPSAMADIHYLMLVSCGTEEEVLACLAELEDAGLLDQLRLLIEEEEAFRPRGDGRSSGVWRGTREKIYSRDNFACVYCGSVENITIDHVVPKCQGGSSKRENLVTACLACNVRKGGKTPEQWMGGGQ